MYYIREKALDLFRKITGRLAEGGVLLTGNHEPFPVEDLPHMTTAYKGLNIYRKTQ